MKAIRFRPHLETRWIERLGSPQTRVRVRLGVVPGRFRTPLGWDTGQRRIAEHLVYFFAKGAARAEVAGDSFLCPRGSCCWVVPGTPFRFHSDQSPLVWRFRFSVTEGKSDRPLAPGRPYYFLRRIPAVAEAIQGIFSELNHRDRWHSAALRTRLSQLALLFFRAASSLSPRTLTARQREVLSSLLEEAPPDARVTPRDLAKAVGLSLDYFSRVFHRAYHMSPRHWLVQERLSHAVVLLQETSLRVGEIAQRLGYANPHFFSRQFAAHFGRSPKSYRE